MPQWFTYSLCGSHATVRRSITIILYNAIFINHQYIIVYYTDTLCFVSCQRQTAGLLNNNDIILLLMWCAYYHIYIYIYIVLKYYDTTMPSPPSMQLPFIAWILHYAKSRRKTKLLRNAVRDFTASDIHLYYIYDTYDGSVYVYRYNHRVHLL